MRKFLIIAFIAASSIGFGKGSLAEADGSIKQLTQKSRINDKAKFLTIRDESGNEHMIKTIGLLEFSDDGIKLKAGKPISIDETEITISQDSDISGE